MLLSIMNGQLLFVFVLIFEPIAIGLKIGDPCITPNQEEATCILHSNCKIIATALATYKPEAAAFAKKSQCGFEMKKGLVCCGSSAYPKFDFDSLFTESPIMISTTPAPPMEEITLSTFSSDGVCGLHSNTSYRIKGGKLTKLAEFPWMAALEYKSALDNTSAGIQCGGSVINERYILTAAHCIRDIELVVIKAWLGVTNISSDDNCISITDTRECADSVQKFNIEKRIVHELYNRADGYHDIGLLRLEKAITFTGLNYIRPICLLSPNSPSPRIGTYMTVAGWGLTGAGEHKSSQVKLKVEVPVTNASFCNEILQGKTIRSGQICAGGEKDKDSCQGDSGGPLMKDFTNAKQMMQWYQEGIVSLGVGCGIERHPAVYTRISTYLSWIVSNVAERKMGEIPLSSLSDESTCGLQTRPRILGGSVATFEEFPWLAALEYESRLDNQNAGFRCGGSVINNRYILTAAHCIVDPEFVVIKAWLGVTNISSDGNCVNSTGTLQCINSTLKVNIEKAIPHPLFNRSHGYGYHDIGLLRLENQITFTNYIRPICLPSSDLPSPHIGARMTISGWDFRENNKHSDLKFKSEVPVQNDSICNELLKFAGRTLGSGQICAGGEKGRDSCEGDNGGPLMKEFQNSDKKTQWYQEGIVSYAIGCGLGGPPDVFTRVARYIPWMISNIDELKLNKSAERSLTDWTGDTDISSSAIKSLLG